MTHAANLSAVLVVLLGANAAHGAERAAQATARATIIEPMVLRMQWATAMPSVRAGAEGAVFAGRMPSMSVGMMMPANARLMIQREDETGEPVTAPGAFEIVSGAGETVILRTSVAAGPDALDEDLVAGGALEGRMAASIDVSRGVFLASAGAEARRTPAALLVTVQYN
ncbi:MAG: hypothetical protein JNK30_17570 [Phenylobacterium sp.]|uniref:hypothetical protein n=1 Tax=Phenylobacterium sp. TaxID=1871053 RepID=UPI001A404D6B|nr:hypothetical protein [Phenylobacterium sp.]MBL8773195.1 hypothetical protein [Phenylobacterium sp.]